MKVRMEKIRPKRRKNYGKDPEERKTPEGMEDAVQTVMAQCELWTDNQDMAQDTPQHDVRYEFKEDVPIAAEGDAQYGSGSAANRLEG